MDCSDTEEEQEEVCGVERLEEVPLLRDSGSRPGRSGAPWCTSGEVHPHSSRVPQDTHTLTNMCFCVKKKIYQASSSPRMTLFEVVVIVLGLLKLFRLLRGFTCGVFVPSLQGFESGRCEVKGFLRL